MAYDPVRGIGTGCQPGMRRLAAYLFDRFGGWDLGCFNPASRAGGGPSLHAEGRAQDFAYNANDPAERDAGDALFWWAVAHHDEIGLQEILWRGFIWSYQRRGEGVRFGVQQAAHMSHVHLGVDRDAGQNWTPDRITDSPPEDDDMKSMLLHKPGDHVVWVYDPANGTRTKVASEAVLAGMKALAPRTGLIVDGPDNGAYEADAAFVDGLPELAPASAVGSVSGACRFEPAPRTFTAA